jgi:hypothetical protein
MHFNKLPPPQILKWINFVNGGHGAFNSRKIFVRTPTAHQFLGDAWVRRFNLLRIVVFPFNRP